MSCNKSLSGRLFSGLLLVAFALPGIASNARFRAIEVPIEYGQLLVRSVAQSASGYILLGTDSGLFQYDGFQVKPFTMSHTDQQRLADVAVNDLLTDRDGVLWLATRGAGLFRYDASELVHLNGGEHKLSTAFISEISSDSNGNLWLATDRGLRRIDGDLQVTEFGGVEFGDARWQFMTALLTHTSGDMLIGTKAGLLHFNQQNHQFSQVVLLPENATTVIYALHQDQYGGIWVGSDDGVFYRPVNSNVFVPFKPELISYKVLSITSKGGDVWIGTISNGLFHYSLSTENLQNFSYQRQNKGSLSDNTILDLFVDSSGVLWVSTFYQGLNALDVQSLYFGLENDASVSCAQNLLFSGFAEDDAGFLWLANGTDLIKYNPSDQTCQRFAFNQGSETIKSVLFDTNNQLWAATTQGLYLFDRFENEFLPLTGVQEQALTHFMMELEPGVFFLGTNQGLFQYTQQQNQLIAIPHNLSAHSRMDVYAAAEGAEDRVYFATSAGVMYHLDGQLHPAEIIQRSIVTHETLQVFTDSLGQLWVGTDGEGVYVFDPQGQLVFQESDFGDSRKDSITSIIEANNGDVWLGTIDSGMIRITAGNQTYKVFYPSDGLQGMSFNINAAYRSDDGRLFMGGRNGFNAFDPQMIQINKQPPKLALTELTRFGKRVSIVDAAHGQMQAGLVLGAPINDMDEITLSHQDYVIGFEFAVLDFSDPLRNQYAFQMEGLDPNWNYVDAENRRISYSNLQAGEYVFRVKGANKHGIWNNQGKSIKLVVLPAPWLTWWAIGSYFMVALLLLFWWVSRRTRINRQINQRLVREVEIQTQALQAEKQTVEALLATKNQLFANVSHEFRTPLTLILGPIKRLLESPLNLDQQQTLNIIYRNANRLLTMIEQLLQLAKMSGKHSVQYHSTVTHLTIDALMHAFGPLAANKRIQLKLLHNDKATVRLSEDALDVIVSNLLSNAIKYTPEGGRVEVESQLQDQGRALCIRVKDSGAGLDAEQQMSVFERFKRLDKDQNIEGIGIGLSVVKELVKLNNGTIQVDSEVGRGSCFTVTFVATDSTDAFEDDNSEVLLVKQLSQVEERPQLEVALGDWDDSDNNEKVLIIDDNADMRNHIAQCLNPHYQCMTASGGKDGIAKAIQFVPDVVICDVMMPEVDGFHVSRVLRSDSRTSHIPLVLLTALDDQASRVRGWREHVDVYLTKPFDAKELLLQLDNILVIRSILNKKAGSSMRAGQDDGLIDLPKKDRQFISKLNQVIVDNYQNPNYSRQLMASEMAVSERQLQRKLKALIDKNPMDLLREYRLNQAAIMLKDGYQVSITADACGFNSLPHFSKCFKSQFGLSPKAYQAACK